MAQQWASLVAQLVKNPPEMWETWVRSLVWEDPLEKGKASQYSILENSKGCIGHGIAKGWTQLNDFHFSLMAHSLELSVHFLSTLPLETQNNTRLLLSREKVGDD